MTPDKAIHSSTLFCWLFNSKPIITKTKTKCPKDEAEPRFYLTPPPGSSSPYSVPIFPTVYKTTQINWIRLLGSSFLTSIRDDHVILFPPDHLNSHPPSSATPTLFVPVKLSALYHYSLSRTFKSESDSSSTQLQEVGTSLNITLETH